MAPALPEAPRVFDPCRETDSEPGAVDPCRRRALLPVNKAALHMDEDEMGLHAADNLAKDSQEMEQILVELGGGDLGQVDLLQAIKTIDSGGDSLSTGDPEAMFPLHGFDLAEAVESESDAADDKIRLQQTRLERRCSFLLRRLRILQARAIGKRVSEEAAQVFERCAKVTRRDGVGRPLGVKAMLKRIETTAALQANTAARSIAKPSYFLTGTSSKTDVSRSATMGVQSGTFSGLEETAGALHSHLSIVKHELDSDATDTSSGAESNDETVVYNNPHQQHMPIEKRALWSWQRRRASVAARWGWLQAQVQELDYKIRQHTDLLGQVREAKGPIEFEGEPTAYSDALPGAPEPPDDDPARETCARIRPLYRESFKKRKLLQMHKLHHATEKAAKPADIRCGCQWPVSGCAVCTGRAVATQPPPPHSTLSARQRLALLDPTYHNPLSDINDVPPSLHLSALSSRTWFRSRCKSGRGAHHTPAAPAHPPLDQGAPSVRRRHPPVKLRRGRPPLSRKIRDSEDSHSHGNQESVSPVSAGVGGGGPVRARGRGSTETRARLNSSYDIDNIVIPQSVAASTRPQILHYKEIVTPKWRIIDVPEIPLNNGILKGSGRSPLDSELEEDLSEEAVSGRHARAECWERGRYARRAGGARARRSHHNSVDAPPPPLPPPPPPPPPPPLLPLPLPPPVPADHVHYETVRPFTPRLFPLADAVYEAMLRDVAADTDDAPPSPAPAPVAAPAALPPPPAPEHTDTESSLSPMSPYAADGGDDPRDAEWDPSLERERHKSSRIKFPLV